ncbi:hypothetical protein G7046_g3367 [Stylonectria norvegica]|nr:hypothetical protein G7046_g3367 [Stylonectria norvegica]
MEQTFMTIHNLTADANILYVSESILDILGYYPQEVLGHSCFDYFHPDEVPFARSVLGRGVLLDKAAVLHYARVLSRDGRWVSCECCFTIVHDVLVACTSIYRRGEKRRAIEAPQIRRIFSCSPRDPRYHMLEHLSPKFKMAPMEREPRAALILNRFTRTLSVMFATEAIGSILGVSAEHVQNKSFYECIQESSLDDAFNCLESAKANDSIAYLRFWSRDPRRPEDFEDEESEAEEDNEDDEDDDEDEELGEDVGMAEHDEDTLDHKTQRSNERPTSRPPLPASRGSSDSDGGGAKLSGSMDIDTPQANHWVKVEADVDMQEGGPFRSDASTASRTASSSNFTSASSAQAYCTPVTAPSSTGAARCTPTLARSQSRARRRLVPSVELEAVVSCTSDGLVVVLRRARPRIPVLHPPLVPFDLDNGLFAAPWGQRPIQPQFPPEALYTFRPPLLPHYMPLRENVKAAGGPPIDQLMSSIRDVAVFAWALVGINGKIASYSHGLPRGEAQPPDGLPIWDPNAVSSPYVAPENQAAQRWSRLEEDEHATYRQAGPYPSGFGSDRSANNRQMLARHGNYALDHGNQWLPQPHTQSPSHTQPQSQVFQSQHFFEQSQPRVSSNPWRDGQRPVENVPTTTSTGLWNDATGRQDAAAYEVAPNSQQDSTEHPYLWRP